jgi:hypothetical protein
VTSRSEQLGQLTKHVADGLRFGPVRIVRSGGRLARRRRSDCRRRARRPARRSLRCRRPRRSWPLGQLWRPGRQPNSRLPVGIRTDIRQPIHSWCRRQRSDEPGTRSSRPGARGALGNRRQQTRRRLTGLRTRHRTGDVRSTTRQGDQRRADARPSEQADKHQHGVDTGWRGNHSRESAKPLKFQPLMTVGLSLLRERLHKTGTLPLLHPFQTPHS